MLLDRVCQTPFESRGVSTISEFWSVGALGSGGRRSGATWEDEDFFTDNKHTGPGDDGIKPRPTGSPRTAAASTLDGQWPVDPTSSVIYSAPFMPLFDLYSQNSLPRQHVSGRDARLDQSTNRILLGSLAESSFKNLGLDVLRNHENSIDIANHKVPR